MSKSVVDNSVFDIYRVYINKVQTKLAKKRETATNLITLHNVQVQISSLFNLRFITYVTVMTIVISLILEYDHTGWQ